MANVVAIVQARLGSSRLPNKVLADLGGKPMLARVVERAQAIPNVDEVIVATTIQFVDDAIVDLCNRWQWNCYRGSEKDVLDRFYRAAQKYSAKHVLRLTADIPLFCVEQAQRVITHHLATGADYTQNGTVFGSGMPLGTGCEIFTFASLAASWREGKEPHHREHVDEFVYEHPERFHIEMVKAPPELNYPALRLTVDTVDDLALIQSVYERLPDSGQVVALRDVVNLFIHEPKLAGVNSHVVQKRY